MKLKLKNPFSRTEPKPDISSYLAASALSGRQNTPRSEEERMREYGLKYQLIEDQALREKIFDLVKLPLGGDDDKDGIKINFRMLGLAFMQSQLIRTTFHDDIDAEIGELEVEQYIDKLTGTLPEDLYEYGIADFLKGAEIFLKTAFADSKRGRKVKIIMTERRGMEVATGDIGKIKPGEGMLGL